MKPIAELASLLEQATADRKPTTPLTGAYPDLDLVDAYRIQRELQRRRHEAGDRLIGYKMGLTSAAKMKQIGIDKPIFGFLTQAMRCADGERIERASLIHPRVEPEIAFVMKQELSGSNCSLDDVLAATAYVAPAMEVLDSRFAGFKFDLVSVIADNTSGARFVVGRTQTEPKKIDVSAVKVVMEINGEGRTLGTGADVLGHPARSVAMLAQLLAAEGKSLPAGAVVMSGGITEAIAVNAGDRVRVKIEGLGEVTVAFA